jgi:hypothetical protein
MAFGAVAVSAGVLALEPSFEAGSAIAGLTVVAIAVALWRYNIAGRGATAPRIAA